MRRTRTRTRSAVGYDVSDGFSGLLRRTASQYNRASDAAESIWPARIGTDGSALGTPVYGATSWPSTPALPGITFVRGENDRVSFPGLVAARAADADEPFTLCQDIYVTDLTLGYFFSWGDAANTWLTIGIYQSAGNIGFLSRRNNGTIDDNIVGASALTVNTRYALVASYAGAGGRFRAITRGSAGETERINATGLATLVNSNYTVADCWIGNAPRAASSAPLSFVNGRTLVFAGYAASDAEMSTLATRMVASYPVA